MKIEIVFFSRKAQDCRCGAANCTGKIGEEAEERERLIGEESDSESDEERSPDDEEQTSDGEEEQDKTTVGCLDID